MLGKRTNTDMTQGVIWRQIVAFAVPMLMGFIFQQLYNTVDSIVVGNFVGKEALAAVGSTGSIINTLIGFFMGLSTGASVVISRLFGAHDEDGVSRAVHTTIVMTLVLAVLFTILGVAMIPFMLRFMSTPADVFGDATTYLTIYFGGVIGLMIYNIGAGILRAVGDSRRPLYFLIFSALVNIAGDLLFVLAFKMGIAGVAIATVISQALSAVLVVIVLMRTDGPHRLVLKKLRLSMPMLKSIMKIGLPAAIQSALTSFSNVFVQSYINAYGSACMAGWSVYGKLDQLAMLPMQSISMASTTFVGQNLGAMNIARAKRGIRTALAISLGCTAVTLVPLMAFARPLLSLFNKDPEVLTFGTMFVVYLSPFYLFACVNDITAGALRGAGQSKAPMIFMLMSFVVFRQVYLFIISRLIDSVLPIAMGYPLGWMLCAICHVIYYKKSNWEAKQDKVLAK
jgi:putative MATE family efflux protein